MAGFVETFKQLYPDKEPDGQGRGKYKVTKYQVPRIAAARSSKLGGYKGRERTKKKQRKKERKEKRKPPAAIEITRVAKAANACSKGGGRQQCLTQ